MISCKVCGGAIPDEKPRAEHTALCAQVVSEIAAEVRGELERSTRAIVDLTRLMQATALLRRWRGHSGGDLGSETDAFLEGLPGDLSVPCPTCGDLWKSADKSERARILEYLRKGPPSSACTYTIRKLIAEDIERELP